MIKTYWHIFTLCLTMILGACGAGGGTGGTSSTQVASNTQISGSVGDGPVTNADITIFDANETEIGSTTSDLTASYRFTLPVGTVMPVEIRATGGLDLVTGRALDFDLVSVVNDSNQTNVNISPLTTLQHEISKCLPQGSSNNQAKEIVASQMSMGLGTTDSQHVVVNESNAAAIVKSNEALGEIVRRSASLLPDNNEAQVLAHIGCDLADGSLDGSGTSSPQVAAVVQANLATVLVEALGNSLQVDGTDATERMNASVLTIQPNAQILTEDVQPDSAVVDLLQRSLSVMQTAYDDEALSEVETVIAANSLEQLPDALAKGLSPATTQALRELPMVTSQAPSEDHNAIADAATLAQEAAAPVVSLSADSTTAAAGDSINLSWSASSADRCIASGDWSGDQNPEGVLTITSLETTSTFNLTCIGLGGSTTASQTVVVQSNSPAPSPSTPPPTQPSTNNPNAPSVSFAASPTSIVAGQSSTLTWTSTNSSSCTASNGWGGNKNVSGSQNTGSLSSTTQFTITCSGDGGNVTDTVTVNVSAPAAPTVNFSPAQLSIGSGESTNLSWNTTNATSCVADGSWSGSKPTGGNENTAELTQNSTYGLTCTGPGGDTRVETSVVVASQDAPRVNLSANVQTIQWGGSATLSWSSTNATTCTTSGAWQGDVDTSGSRSFTDLTSYKRFIMTCTGAGGSTTVATHVYVQAPQAPILTLSTTQSNLNSGQSAVLSWSSANTESCTASGTWSGSKALSGSESTGSLTANSSFTLTCNGPGGQVSKSVSVNVQESPTTSVTLNASQDWVNRSESTTLNWSATGASNCLASGDWSGSKSLSGSEQTSPLNADATYTLTCSDGNNNAVAITAVSVRQALLTWSKPTTNTNGTPLTNLAGYKIYWGTSSGQYPNILTIDNADTTSRTIELAPGSYYFNLKAINSEGTESVFSGERSKIIQ